MKEVTIEQAGEYLEKGGVVIYPTETAYGIGCDATNSEAVDLIFKIKQRPRELTLPVIFGDLIMAKKYVSFNDQEMELAKKYWPGPLTLVVVAKSGLASGCLAKDGTVALRVPGNVLAQKLSLQLGKPIVSTSANLTGQEEIYSVQELQNKFGEEIYVVNGGILPQHLPSTIVRINKNGETQVLRQGEIKLETLL